MLTKHQSDDNVRVSGRFASPRPADDTDVQVAPTGVATAFPHPTLAVPANTTESTTSFPPTNSDSVSEIVIPFYSNTVAELQQKIENTPEWKEAFTTAISDVAAHGIEMQGIHDVSSFLQYLSNLLVWMPSEEQNGKFIYDKYALFTFIFDQDVISALPDSQNPIDPSQYREPKRYLTDWLQRYTRSLGSWLSSPESISEKTIETFKNTPSFNLQDYIEPEGSWKSFNDFFTRKVKPEARPIADINDPTTIIQPADSVYDGAWPVDDEGQIVFIKGVPWSIEELLNGSRYADDFKGGIFAHSFLNINDYHRQHAPISGKVLEVQNIDGYVYSKASVANSLKDKPANGTLANSTAPAVNETAVLPKTPVTFLPGPVLTPLENIPIENSNLELRGSQRGSQRGERMRGIERSSNSNGFSSSHTRSRFGLDEEGFTGLEETGKPELVVSRRLQLDDEPGFQFLQVRGLIVFESKELGGKIAVLPIGMGQCSSVVITVNEGDEVKKGDEISYFQFGGSDVVVVHSKEIGVEITAEEGVKYKMGQKVAEAKGRGLAENPALHVEPDEPVVEAQY